MLYKSLIYIKQSYEMLESILKTILPQSVNPSTHPIAPLKNHLAIGKHHLAIGKHNSRSRKDKDSSDKTASGKDNYDDYIHEQLKRITNENETGKDKDKQVD